MSLEQRNLKQELRQAGQQVPQLEESKGETLAESAAQDIARLPQAKETEEKIDLINSLSTSAKSLPKILEASGYLTLGNISYLLAGEKGFNFYLGISNNIFSNFYGGAIFEKQNSFASMSDQQLWENLNPLHHLGQTVEPLLKPLHIASAKVTDNLTYYGYNFYVSQTESATGISYQEYQRRKSSPEHWELRAGENTLYALEALGIAYLMVTRGGIISAVGGKANSIGLLIKEGGDMAKLMRMPIFMSALSSIGDMLQRDEPERPPLISIETLTQLTPMIIKGTFDSLVFMSFISSVSRSVVSLQSARLYSAAEKELQLAKVAGNSELPTKVAELPKRIQNLSKYSEYAAESVDIAEGLPDFFKNSENFGNRALHLLANPFELKRYRELSGAALQLTASALDLVDRRQSGETSRLRNQPTTVSSVFSQELNQEIENLGGATVTEHGRVLYLKDQQAVATLYQRRAEELQLKLEENPFSFKGIKSMLIGTATASSITEASNTIQAFYDKEYGVTVTSVSTTEIAKRRHDAYIAHEAVHKTIDEIGLTAFIQREERYCRIVENNMHIDIDTLLEKKDGPLQLEELFAHIAEYEVLNTYGLDNFKDAGVEIAFLEHENPFITNYEKISDFVFENYPHQGMDLEYSTTLLAGQDGRKNRRKREKAERFARRTEAIDRAHEITTGKVPLSGQPFDFGSAILTFSQQTYQAQLAVERLLYEAIGMSREVIDGLIKKHEPRKREWIRELMAYQQPIAVGWGGAADQIITKDKNAEKIITSIQEVANRLVLPERKFGLMHGSSTTGFMGAYDRAWLQAATAIYGDKYLEHIGIFTIPLCWTTDEVREIAAESGLAAHVCPPHLFLPLRTLDFALRKPIFYMCSPGGMGTNFEIAFIMLEWQLRKMLVTVASSWNTPTPIYLMDYKMGKESLNAQAEELAKQYNVSVAEVKKSFHLSNRWFYDGLREHFNRQVLARACKPSNIENVYILRVGKGEDIEFGIKVYYFDTEQELADYVAAEADKDLAADPEGLRGRRIHLP